MNKKNIDIDVVNGFGDEWSRFNQNKLETEEHDDLFNRYFTIFPWNLVSKESVGFDMGCGSGRWAKLVAPKVGLLHCVDPSVALDVAKKNLEQFDNCVFHSSSTDECPIAHCSMDFGYSLGVLHHIPNTLNALKDCVNLLKPGAPFLLYLYYAFDNKPKWFLIIFKISDFLRFFISRLPHSLRFYFSQFLAYFIYFPFSRISLLLEKVNVDVTNFPLSAYRNCSLYTMQTDALDRFGTRLEQRFTRSEIEAMMEEAGLTNIRFNNSVPYWCAVGIKK
jgi:SAM-dependent methyltransferase